MSSAADSETARYCPRAVESGLTAVRSKTHWIGVPTAGDERLVEHVAVVDDVDVDDRRRCQARRGQPGSQRDRSGRRAGVSVGRRRHGQDDVVDEVVTAASRPAQPPASRGSTTSRPWCPTRTVAPAAQRARRGVAVQLAAAVPAPSRCRPRRSDQQADLEDHRGQRQRGLAAGAFSVAMPTRSHSASMARRSARARPASRRSCARRRPGRCGRAGAAPARPATTRSPLRRAQHRIAQPAIDRGAAAPAGRCGAAGRPGRAGALRTGTSSRSCSVDPVATPSRLQQALVGGAAAQEDVLAVVDAQLAAPERVGETAQPRPRLEQRDRAARRRRSAAPR